MSDIPTGVYPMNVKSPNLHNLICNIYINVSYNANKGHNAIGNRIKSELLRGREGEK